MNMEIFTSALCGDIFDHESDLIRKSAQEV